MLALLAPACGSLSETTSGTSPEILWDTWGVPHIYSSDDTGLFHGFGWAQAESHADLVLELVGLARGRGAEYWGEKYLDSDRWMWTAGIPSRAGRWLEDQDPEIRSLLDAFAAGFNDYAERHRDRIDDRVEVVLPVSAGDFLAHTHRVLHFTFVARSARIDDFRQRYAERAAVADNGDPYEERWSAGSNAWAVGPDRSASGHALLVSNPHLPWNDLFTWYEAHLVGPGIDLYGAALVGTPFLSIGFNDHLGWTHTVNMHDGADLFELTLEGDGYLYDGEVLPIETTEIDLAVRQEDGSLRREAFLVRSSQHGPIIAVAGNKALALAVVGLDAPELMRQYWDMGRARGLADFEAALRRMQMPMFTFMYADREGNVMHHFGGRTPIRTQGDWAAWSRPVPGDTSAWAWNGIHTFDELPTVLNPDSGWLQNANDPPWTTTFPRALDPQRFPPYMAPRFMHFRAQRSAKMLLEDDSVTFDEALAYKLSSRMELADRILDDLEAAVAAHGDAKATEAIECLSTWDRQAEARSRGAVLFAAFFDRMEAIGQSLRMPLPATGFAVPWSPEAPLATPDGLRNPAAAAAALSDAARTVEERYGALDVAWGDAFRFRRGSHDHPLSGGPESLGIFRVASVSSNEEGPRHVEAGDSWISVVEFSQPLRARVLLAYGNATQPDSPHYGDQLELFARGELRTPWRSRDEIETNMARRDTLNPGN